MIRESPGQLRAVDRREGSPTNVAYDLEFAIGQKDLAGWMHTHPNMPAYLSGQDIRAMHSSVNCFNVPLLQVVIGDDRVRAWRFEPDTDDYEEIQFGSYFRDNGKFTVNIAEPRELRRCYVKSIKPFVVVDTKTKEEHEPEWFTGKVRTLGWHGTLEGNTFIAD